MPRDPLVPAKAGTQNLRDWIPAYAGMSGARCRLTQLHPNSGVPGT
jgi:hypothetical protein